MLLVEEGMDVGVVVVVFIAVVVTIVVEDNVEFVDNAGFVEFVDNIESGGVVVIVEVALAGLLLNDLIILLLRLSTSICKLLVLDVSSFPLPMLR